MGRPPAIKLGFTKLNSLLRWPAIAAPGFRAAAGPPAQAPSLNSFLIENFTLSHDLETLEDRCGIEAARLTKRPELCMVIFSRTFVRRRIISLAASLSVSATSFALAQDPGKVYHLRRPVNDRGE